MITANFPGKRSRLFVAMFTALAAVFIVDLLFSLSGDTQQSVIFNRGGNFLADFFNNVIFSRNLDPYFDGTGMAFEHTYPPLCYLVFRLFKPLIAVSDLHAMQGDAQSVAVALSFALVCALALAFTLARLTGRALLVPVFLFSGGMVFTVERGNLLLLEHSMGENILRLLDNATHQTVWYFENCPPNLTFPSYFHQVAIRCFPPADVLTFWLQVGGKLLAVACCVTFFLAERRWQRLFLLSAAMLFGFYQMNWYSILYFYPAICRYLADESPFRRQDWLYGIAFCVMLTPLQFGVLPLSPNSINPMICSFLLYPVTLAVVFDVIGSRREARMGA